MDLGIQDEAVAVFGGGRGIGRGIAEAFAGEGCRVGIFDRGEDTEEMAGALSKGGLGVVGDVADGGAVAAAAARFCEAFGTVHHVVYAVGAGSGKAGFPFWNLEPSDWPRVLEVNLVGAVHVAHAFARRLAGQRSGTVLFLASVAGQIGSQTDPPYSAAKAGLINFMQCAARDFAPYGVRANCLSPGMVRTELNASVWRAVQGTLPEGERPDYEDWGREKVAKVAPLGRWQEPAEFGAMAVYLASGHARNITGQVINIDGGQVMHA